MKVIILEVTDRAGNDYLSLSEEGKQRFNKEVVALLRNIVRDERMGRLVALLDEINNDGLGDVHPDILVQLLSMEPLNG